MITLTNLSLSGNQKSPVQLADGSSVTLTFIYLPAVQRWSVNISYPTTGYVETGIGLSTNYNLLRRLRHNLPFGLQVLTADGTDPFLPSDLAPGSGGTPPRVTINVLDGTNGSADIQDVEDAYFSATAPASC